MLIILASHIFISIKGLNTIPKKVSRKPQGLAYTVLRVRLSYLDNKVYTAFVNEA
jgi:hypothetical protein